ncbi:hypothetical protein CGERO_08385 [Corynebacterium gerontici]|uniref:Uncharacterized protein n=1 Tax=Corynebacterium gerontici TaxID=2079234 RepID=A0A3G6J206_9CORY|nr:hypothetical protein CGERO_08385 [Corynebacterium gerontici]
MAISGTVVGALIPVILVLVVQVAVVQVIDVVAVGDGDVAAAFAVGVLMILVDLVFGGAISVATLIPVILVLVVQVAVVQVIDVVAVGDGDVTAAFAVGVLMILVDGVVVHEWILSLCCCAVAEPQVQRCKNHLC